MNPILRKLAEMKANRIASIGLFRAALELVTQFLMVCAVILIMWAVIRMEARRDDLDQREYCNNVRDGLWPDYRHSFKAECGGKEPPEFHEDLTK